MSSQWKQEHRFLYNEDGSPTEDLLRLQKETEEPSTTAQDPPQFPIIRLSHKVQRMITKLRTAAYRLGEAQRVGEAAESGDEKASHGEKILEAYRVLGACQKELSEYVEQLEYHCNIPRPEQIRF